MNGSAVALMNVMAITRDLPVMAPPERTTAHLPVADHQVDLQVVARVHLARKTPRSMPKNASAAPHLYLSRRRVGQGRQLLAAGRATQVPMVDRRVTLR